MLASFRAAGIPAALFFSCHPVRLFSSVDHIDAYLSGLIEHVPVVPIDLIRTATPAGIDYVVSVSLREGHVSLTGGVVLTSA
ncbi:hypothetical protein [Pelagibius sp. Alg239-R121]|uniref:hypothetical protein n=1 Tax=Pelagibius sp. Alg239-R121 TaxID=2993448 RepID=UPI0024A695A2|nr:hypothetical protein [Pelagibius sp. Alg239-R121]